MVGSALPEVDASGRRGGVPGPTQPGPRGHLRSADTSSGLQHINVLGGFDAIWEIDLFGKYRREMQAARADAQATAAQRNVVLVAVIPTSRAPTSTCAACRCAPLSCTAPTILAGVSTRGSRRYERGITNELDVTLATRELGVLESQVAP